MKTLRNALLILATGICIILLCIGSLTALVLGFLGILVFFGAACERIIDLAGFALFGVTTVALASVCCFMGLLFLIDSCLNCISSVHPALDKPKAALSLSSVLVTVALFLSTQGQYFEPVCIGADVLYVAFVLLYIQIKRGKTHDPH